MAGRSRGRNNRYQYNNNSRNNEHDDRTSRPSTSRGGGYSDHQSFNKRVTFKANNRGNNKFRKSWENKSDLVRDQLDNEFSNRNGPHRNSGGRRRSFPERNSGGRGGHNNFRASWTLKKSSTGWYSIFVPNVDDGDEVLKIIQTYIAPITLVPFNKNLFDNCLRFLVDDYKVAETLHNTSYKLSLRDGRKLVIKVTLYSPSRYSVFMVPVPDEIKAKMIEAMSTRYNPNTRSIDLSRFHSSQIFVDNQMFVPLNQPAFLLAALNLIAQQTKYDMYGLSLENNYIYLGEGLIWIRRLFPDLKILDLSGNKLNDVKDLQELSGFTIEVLNLSRNPVSDKEDKERYRREIQQLFPLITKLDDYELPCRYSAIVGTKLKMPINLGNSYAIPAEHNPEQPNPVAVLVDAFLAQYYERYDNQVSKQLVAEAYHENATFSMSSCFLSEKSKGNLMQYLPESRNLFKLSEMNSSKRSRFIHKGRENIINFLEKLPKTKHDLGSFTVDVPLANSAMVQIVVNGAFAEEYIDNKKLTLRSFSRIFAITPVGNGWSIISDMLFITAANMEMLSETAKRFYVPKPRQSTSKRYNQESNGNNNNNSGSMFMDDVDDMGDMNSVQQSPTPNYPPPSYQQTMYSSNQQPYQTPQTFQSNHQPTNTLEQNTVAQAFQINVQQTSQANQPFYNVPATSVVSQTPPETTINTPIDRAMQLTMIKRFSDESGMNEEWAEKCLTENNWHYANAAVSFSKLKDNIPPQAFRR
ncbi:nuclear RNA export factor 1-like isoform X2 [Adelges cooleyi]|uniref:nuclear RNA export factor 1-like isoform X2 n=1 Tax=Adelges cooleyi TaxID=133065 RepID=UPI00217F6185|nr:nuclear RNA export factor 1-like isoform X2 [Adelges cooleyi]